MISISKEAVIILEKQTYCSFPLISSNGMILIANDVSFILSLGGLGILEAGISGGAAKK